MTLRLSSDLSSAQWIVQSDVPWLRLVTFGPAGFEAAARLRFLPDPAFQGQSENDVQPDDDRSDVERIQLLLELLGAKSRTPNDCYFCLWDGYGELYAPSPISAARRHADRASNLEEPSARPGLAPVSFAAPPVLAAPKLVLPYRAYYLFRGALAESGEWGSRVQGRSGAVFVPPPAFVWPADHAWCIANDVDPHWAGISASQAIIDELVAAPSLDVVPTDPDGVQPSYY